MSNKPVPSENAGKQVTPANLNKDDSKGKTTIHDQVVTKVAGLAIRDIEGVYALGSAMGRAMGSIRQAVGGSEKVEQGVSVEVGETEAAIDLSLIVEYPYPVHEVADKVRNAVFEAVEGLVGLKVTEVNIDVTDVHLPDEDDDEDEVEQIEEKKESRVK